MEKHILIELPDGADKDSCIKLNSYCPEKQELTLEIDDQLCTFKVDKIPGTIVMNYKEKSYNTTFYAKKTRMNIVSVGNKNDCRQDIN